MPETIRVITLAKQGPAGPIGPTGPIGPPFGVGQFTTATDPAVDAAVTQAIVDAGDGVVITLTAAGNAQTIAPPSDVTPGKAFAVVNDTASGANTVAVNGIVLTAGNMIDFRWDGAAYVLDTVRLVDSVNGQIGAVVLDPDDLDDSATTNKFTDAADISKLAGIETAATADQTGAEIKVAYEGEADTNAFTDAEQTKLTGIESGATADQTDVEIKTAYENNGDTNAFTDTEKTKLAGLGFTYGATAADLLTAGQNIIGVTDTTVARTITISSADIAREGMSMIIKDESGGAATNNITIATEALEKIDGVDSVDITVNYGVLRIYTNGSNLFSF